jgi:hypothetical protein
MVHFSSIPKIHDSWSAVNDGAKKLNSTKSRLEHVNKKARKWCNPVTMAN